MKPPLKTIKQDLLFILLIWKFKYHIYKFANANVKYF